MVRKRRICGKGLAYHITARRVHRKFLFTDELFPLILAVWRRAKEKYNFKLYGYCPSGGIAGARQPFAFRHGGAG